MPPGRLAASGRCWPTSAPSPSRRSRSSRSRTVDPTPPSRLRRRPRLDLSSELTPAEAIANFPAADIAALRTITQDTLDLVVSGDQGGARTRITDLETAWDDAQPTLEPLDETAWTFLDSEIDDVLSAVRAGNPDPAAEQEALTALNTSLAG